MNNNLTVTLDPSKFKAIFEETIARIKENDEHIRKIVRDELANQLKAGGLLNPDGEE